MRLSLLIIVGVFIIIGIIVCMRSSEGFGSAPAVCPKAQKTSRNLWYYHVAYTRDYLVKYLDNLAGADDALAVLMKNQEDLGAFIDTMAPGTQTLATNLLKEHIAGAGAILADAKASRDMTNNIDAWYRNADNISRTLAPALRLSEPMLREMMHTHLQTTLDEATKHLQGDRCGEQEAYRKVVEHILKMADYLVSTKVCKCPQ